MNTPRTLVTGASGFLGRHLLRTLHEQGIPAAALLRDPAPFLARDGLAEAGPIALVEGNVLDPSPWQDRPELGAVRTIFHTAALVRHTRQSPEAMLELNVGGTLRMVRLAQRLNARLVLVSSSGTVGCFRHLDLAADEHAPFAEALVGAWPYYASKVRAEREGRQLAEKLGVDLVVVRPPVLLGPDDHRFRSTGHVLRVLENKLPMIPQGGMHFTDVRDAAAAIVRIAGLETARPVYHLPGTAQTLVDFFRTVSEVAGVPIAERQVASWLFLSLVTAARRAARIARRSPPSWIPDPVVAEMSGCYWGVRSLWSETELDYRPRPARQTLLDTVAFLRAHHPALRSGQSHAA